MAGISENQLLREKGGEWYPARNEPPRRLRPNELDIKPIVPRKFEEENIENENEIVELAVNIATLMTENLLSHPFTVLRRQCQVQPDSHRRHLIPISLVPVVIRLHQCQGVTTLWKGLGSCLLVRGMTLAVEDILTKFTPWPKEMPQNPSCKNFGQHILLKCVSLAVITPFYSASLVETVQSDIASEKPGFLDVFKEGICRVISWGSPARGRMLPVWALVGPTVLHGILKYLISLTVTVTAERTIHLQNRAEQSKRGALYKDSLNEDSVEQVRVTASFIGMVTAEVLCYPLETILHRLHLQGTRTIVDNLDSGSQVVPILTGYGGIIDCYSETVANEGTSGLFKGFGALILQFAVHWAVIRLTRTVVSQCAVMFRSQARPPPNDPRKDFSSTPVAPVQQIITTPSTNYPWREQRLADEDSSPYIHEYPLEKMD